jgi:predicted negative regulator of RcsB-dependent stress response
MQTQDAPAEFLFKLWPWLEANKNRLIGVGVALIVFAGILYFISSQKQQKEIDAGQALTSLLMNPAAANNLTQMSGELEELAGKYPGTAAGQRARLQAAGALFEAGNYSDAQTQFGNYLNASSTGPLAAIAELGLGASLEAQNKLDDAAAAYQRVVSVFPDSSCVSSAEFALGRIAEQQNKLTEAMNHYEDAAHSPLGGTVAQEAMMREADLKTKLAAAPQKPAATPSPAQTFVPLSIPQPAAKP